MACFGACFGRVQWNIWGVVMGVFWGVVMGVSWPCLGACLGLVMGVFKVLCNGALFSLFAKGYTNLRPK